MNIVLTVHPGTPNAFEVTLTADGPEGVANITTDDENDGFIDTVISASRYLSGLDGKLVTPLRNATVADLALVIGKYVEGDMEVTAGRIPPGRLTPPMSAAHQEGDE